MRNKANNAAELSETKLLDQILSRRRAMMFGGSALAALALGNSVFAQTAPPSDTDILNFALNLEYLEAEYYTLATTGLTIDKIPTPIGITGPTGTTPGTVTSKANPMVPFTDLTIKAYATEIAMEERNHVTVLRSALGSAAIAQPAIDLQTSFNTLATLAGIPTPFDPFAIDLNFLLGAYIFEDVGVTAYHGAAALLSSPANVTKAAGLLGAESYHAGLIRTKLFELQTASTPPALDIFKATQAISAARATLDGSGTSDDVGLSVVGSSATIVNADADSIAFARTTTQVIKIVSAFFPSGLNGKIVA